MVDISAMFRDRALLVLQYVVDEKIKKMRYLNMLRDKIWEFVSVSSCRTLEDMIYRSRK